MTDILLIVLIGLFIYREFVKKPAKNEQTIKSKVLSDKVKTDEADELTKEMEEMMSYKIDDAIDAYRKGGN